MITIGAHSNKLKNQVGDLFQTWSKNTKNPDQQYTKIKIIKEKKKSQCIHSREPNYDQYAFWDKKKTSGKAVRDNH